MNKLIQLVAALMLCLCFCVPAGAAQDEGRVYVIKKGDTLWGLSERFITDPYYWPNLWANNPFIRNPHLIYPGQKVMVRDGRLTIIPEGGTTDGSQPVDPSSLPPLPDPIDEVRIKTHAGSEGFIVDDEFQYSGRLVDFVDTRLIAATGDIAFADFKVIDDVFEGDEFMVYRKSRDILHPRTGKPFGTLIEELGSVRVQSINDQVGTMLIIRTAREVARGDLLKPAVSYNPVITLKQAPKTLYGVVVTGREDKTNQGANELIYVDIGSKMGLEVGNMLDISRPRERTKHAIKEDLKLPERLLGVAVVVDVKPNSAVALLVKSVDAIRNGDSVRTVTP